MGRSGTVVEPEMTGSDSGGTAGSEARGAMGSVCGFDPEMIGSDFGSIGGGAGVGRSVALGGKQGHNRSAQADLLAADFRFTSCGAQYLGFTTLLM